MWKILARNEESWRRFGLTYCLCCLNLSSEGLTNLGHLALVSLFTSLEDFLRVETYLTAKNALASCVNCAGILVHMEAVEGYAEEDSRKRILLAGHRKVGGRQKGVHFGGKVLSRLSYLGKSGGNCKARKGHV